MNQKDSEHWKSRVLDEIFAALAASKPLDEAYRAKVKKPGEAVRAKDLYDISRIRRLYGLEKVEFWRMAGEEFYAACRSRYIDCRGLATFQEHGP